jgi:pantoate kinase
LLRGSIGAGFSVIAGTTTEVHVEPRDELKIVVDYNGSIIDATVTRTVVQQLVGQVDSTFSVQVSHKSDLPIGVGFGASGAGALGTALALGNILGLEKKDALHAAHYAEVVNHAGLGDVLAQYYGGIEIRTRPGAPGTGFVESIPSDADLSVVLAGAPGIETKDVLTDPESKARINEHGENAMRSLLEMPTFEKILEYSRTFASSTGLMTERVRSALDVLDKNGLHRSSMVMLGDSVFCICDQDSRALAIDCLQDYWNTSEILETSISTKGGRLIE